MPLPTREELLGADHKKLLPHWPDVDECLRLVEKGHHFGEYDDIKLLFALERRGLIELSDDPRNIYSPVYTNLQFVLTYVGLSALREAEGK